jgi:hypothetical protein
MGTDLEAQRSRSQRSPAFRARIAALCGAWTAYTLSRAIADVAATTEQDYRDFGLDKGEILAELRRLHDQSQRTALRTPATAHVGAGRHLSIAVARRMSADHSIGAPILEGAA